MSGDIPNRWYYTLADHNGLWCAQCLRYFRNNAKEAGKWEEHHLLRRSVVKQEFGQHYSNSWRVPVHWECHKEDMGGIDLHGKRVAEKFRDILKRRPSEISQTIKHLHDKGIAIPSFLLKMKLIKHFQETGNTGGIIRNIEYGFATGSMIGWAPQMMKSDSISRYNNESIPVLLNRAKIEGLRGRQHEAEVLLDKAEARQAGLKGVPKKRSKVILRRARTSVVTNRKAVSGETVSASLEDALFCVKEAENPYTLGTATLLELMLRYRNGQLSKSRDLVEQLANSRAEISWAYRARFLFYRALIGLEQRESLSSIYRYLVASQYISCMLGIISGICIGESRIDSTLPPSSCTPGHILINLGIGKGFYPKELTELRRQTLLSGDKGEAIWHGIRKDLLDFG